MGMKQYSKGKTLRLKWLILWSLWAARFVQQPTSTIELSNGPVRGTIAPDGSHAMYLGIPYATVTERFQSPGPEPKWETVYDAIKTNVVCFQHMPGKFVIGTTNCLVLNVYTPLNTTPSSKLPVMAFIHGGGYFEGSASSRLYGPKYLVSKGVILVTFNYRLNLQGFLCLGIKEAPGNAGMKDQVAALRWIKRNIQKLGGDPDNVTIFGESAGAASVSFHLYSPMSKGLFHKAITQSGSALCPWSYQFRPIFLAGLLTKVMLYESNDPHEIYKYLMTRSDADFIEIRVPRQKGNIVGSEILYTPCPEKYIDGEELFITELPFHLLTKGEYNKVPMMIGATNEEGLFMMTFDNSTMIPQIRFEKALPKNLEFPSEKDKLEVAKYLEKIYMNGKEISMQSLLEISRFIGEFQLIYPSLEETELLLKTNENPIYNYVFQYSGMRNIPKWTVPWSWGQASGATHADDLFYLFSQEIIPDIFDKDMIEHMSTMWTNFAKHGDPTPDFTKPLMKWHRTNSSTPTAFVIDSEFDTAPLWFNDRLKYIREVYTKYRRKLIKTAE